MSKTISSIIITSCKEKINIKWSYKGCSKIEIYEFPVFQQIAASNSMLFFLKYHPLTQHGQ
jgi:hypothetical protein